MGCLTCEFLGSDMESSDVELVIYRSAREALNEIHDAACSAHRSVGQLLRMDRHWQGVRERLPHLKPERAQHEG